MFLAIIITLSTLGNITYAKVSDDQLNEVVENTAKFMYRVVENPQVGSIGGEWEILGLARSGYKIPDSYSQRYYNVVA